MPLTNTQYASVMRVYDDIRSHNQALQTERYNEVVNKCPEYSLIENEIITLSMKEASRRIVSDSSDTDLDEYNLKLKKLYSVHQPIWIKCWNICSHSCLNNHFRIDQQLRVTRRLIDSYLGNKPVNERCRKYMVTYLRIMMEVSSIFLTPEK